MAPPKKSKWVLPKGIQIRRHASIHLYPFERYFRGFESSVPIQELFGRRAPKILRALKVEFFSPPFGYMGTSDEDGHLIVSSHHLKTSDLRTLYLDVVHELCHVKQFRAGRPLFDRNKKYVDTPTEIEAYAFTIKEGQRIGMTNAELLEYLKVEWVDEPDHRRLARRLKLLPSRPRARRRPSRRRPAR
ncbi:MAG: hypothetical protein ACREBT_05210 [Thermoplasmata archaeon]